MQNSGFCCVSWASCLFSSSQWHITPPRGPKGDSTLPLLLQLPALGCQACLETLPHSTLKGKKISCLWLIPPALFWIFLFLVFQLPHHLVHCLLSFAFCLRCVSLRTCCMAPTSISRPLCTMCTPIMEQTQLYCNLGEHQTKTEETGWKDTYFCLSLSLPFLVYCLGQSRYLIC